MKKALIFLLVCAGFEGLIGYSVHMFVGGQVSPDQEQTYILIALAIGACVLVVMGIDLLRQHKRQV